MYLGQILCFRLYKGVKDMVAWERVGLELQSPTEFLKMEVDGDELSNGFNTKQ